MKFYIAARFNRKQEAEKIAKKINKLGHQCETEWLKDKPINRPYTKVSDIAKRRAKRDVKAISNSDVFILLSEKYGDNKGIYVELGVAIESYLQAKKPKIYVIGKFKDHGLFFFHPSVKRLNTFENVLVDLKII